jgi:hypothetical protein
VQIELLVLSDLLYDKFFFFLKKKIILSSKLFPTRFSIVILLIFICEKVRVAPIEDKMRSRLRLF